MGPKEVNHGLERVRFQLRADGIATDSSNTLVSGVHGRGYLPHVKREGASYFVTFRLPDALPKEVLHRFLSEKMERLRLLEMGHQNRPATLNSGTSKTEHAERIEREYRRKVERYLDRGCGTCHLRQPRIADMVAQALQHHHEERYVLDDWVIMPTMCTSFSGRCPIRR